MRYYISMALCLTCFTIAAQSKKISQPISQSEREYRFEQIVVNAACAESWKRVRAAKPQIKGIKFSEEYQYGDEFPYDDPNYDSTYCISGYFTYRGDFNEAFGEYYYCWLKLISIKPEKWKLQILKFSALPFNE